MGFKALSISRKQIREGIKKGYTKELFCSKYYCSPLDFDTHIEKIYGNDQKAVQGIFSELKANEKKARKRQPVNKEQVELPEEVTTTEVDEVEELKKRESILSDEIIKLENTHKNLVEQLRGHRASMHKIKEGVQKLQQELEAKCKSFEEEANKANIVIAAMNDISADRRPKVEELASIREQISELTALTLCVYENGDIAPYDKDIELDVTGSDEIYRDLLEQELVETLRVKDVRTLARVIAIINNIGNSTKVNLLFDREELEAAYNQYN